MAYQYASENKLLKSVHDFDNDVLSAAMNLSKRYHSYSPHIDALTKMSTMIFHAIQKVHGMGSREQLLLQVAVNPCMIVENLSVLQMDRTVPMTLSWLPKSSDCPI